MSYVIGRRGGETYPEPPRPGGSSSQPAFAFDQNTDAYLMTVGDPPETISISAETPAHKSFPLAPPCSR